MIILAPGTGNLVSSIEEGTWASHPSSSSERVDALEVYQEPAWLASLVLILSGLISRTQLELSALNVCLFLVLGSWFLVLVDGDGDGDGDVEC